jgi:hypothetical protein
MVTESAPRCTAVRLVVVVVLGERLSPGVHSPPPPTAKSCLMDLWPLMAGQHRLNRASISECIRPRPQEEFKEPYMKVQGKKISKAEYDKLWEKIDTDKSGDVSVKELAEYYGFEIGLNGKVIEKAEDEMDDDSILEALRVHSPVRTLRRRGGRVVIPTTAHSPPHPGYRWRRSCQSSRRRFLRSRARRSRRSQRSRCRARKSIPTALPLCCHSSSLCHHIPASRRAVRV